MLTVSTAPVFAMGWLIPRLEAFRQDNPEVAVRLDTSMALVDFSVSDVDVAIRYTDRPDQVGLITHWLFNATPVLVSTPSVAAHVNSVADLRRATLLHSTTNCGNWHAWLRAANVDDIDPTSGLEFANDTLALEAAMQGLGIAIAHRRIAERWIDDGRLALVLDTDATGTHDYFLVYPESSEQQSDIRAFRDWLLRAVSARSGTDMPARSR